MIAGVFKLIKSKVGAGKATLGAGGNLDQARQFKQQRHFDAAAAACTAILATHPDQMEALELLAEIAAEKGDRRQAIQWYDKIIGLEPSHAVAFYRRGNHLKDSGKPEAAAASYEQAIALDPGYANAYCNLGVVLASLNRLDEALSSYDGAIALNPQDALSHYNRAAVLRELKRLPEALESSERAIAASPEYVEAYCNRGVLLQELARSDEALAAYDQAIALNARLPLAYLNRASLLQERNQLAEALADYDRALEIDPAYVDGHFRRGLLLKVLGQWDAAIVSFDRAIALNQNLPEAYCNRASALVALNKLEAALASYDQGFTLNPDLRLLLALRLHTKMYLCDWKELDADVQRLAYGVESGRAVSPPFHAITVLDSASLLYKAARLWTREEYPEDHSLSIIPKLQKRDRIRIGYFSADFRDHVVALVTAEMFERHDRARFEIIAFSSGVDTGDLVRKRLERAFDRFIDVSGMAAREVALLARSLEIDIAVDLGGHTQGAATAVFALRAAPIQVNYLGYPGTMGAEYMDYIISDRTVIPESQQRFYTEKVVYLPHSYLPYDSGREISARTITREELGLPADGFVFCCFNNSYKINPHTFDGWMRILKRVDRSVLWLGNGSTAVMNNLRREAAVRGVNPKRLIFANRVPSLSLHLARHRAADLFLDTLPFNAHSTAMDALWGGLPVLTCAGESFAGRVAASLLLTIELPELIASTPEEYEKLAVELATNPRRLENIQEKLARNKLSTPLFDTRLFVKHLEAAYAKIYDRHHANLPPECLYIA